MTEIPSTPADGNTKVVWVPTLADYTKPTADELTAQTAVDISCYLTGDGWSPTSEQATIPDSRLCSRQEFGRPGRKTPGLSVTVVDNTNTDDPNAAIEALLEGTEGYYVERRGIPYEEPFAAEQKIRVFPARCGEHQPVAPEANSVFRTTIPQFISADVKTTAVAGTGG